MAKNYRAELTGVFGCPVDENPTGVIEEAGYEALGLNFRYLTMKVKQEDLANAVAGARAVGMRGFNLTIPHKVEVIQYLDELSEAAQIIGAVNTVINKDGKLYGENTDGKGFLTSLTENGVDVKGKQVTLLGAGGAARAVATELALAGAAKITIINRSVERGSELAAMVHVRAKVKTEFLHWTSDLAIPEGTDILVQCTNIGLFPDVEGCPSINFETVTSDMVCCDVVFNKPNTPFLQKCAERGAKTIDGLGMLVNQAALNFKMWTGEDAPIDVMTKALQREFE